MKQVDELIRGELAAIKSFDAVLPKIKDTNEKQKLSEMRMDHVKAVDSLKRFVRNFDEKMLILPVHGAHLRRLLQVVHHSSETKFRSRP